MSINERSKASNNQEWNRVSLAKAIQQLMNIQDSAGTIVKFALLSGLNKEELLMLHQREMCLNDLRFCNCNKGLHFRTNASGVVFISLSNGTTTRFATIPDVLWRRFMDLVSLEARDIASAERVIAELGLDFDDIFKIYHIVSAGGHYDRLARAKPLFLTPKEIEFVLEDYVGVWEIFGLIFSIG